MSVAVTGTADDTVDLEQFFAVVAEDLALLSTLHEREPDGELIQTLREIGFPRELGLRLCSKEAVEAQRVVAAALAAMPGEPGPAVLDELAADYASIYLTHRIKASPEESVWVHEEHLTHQESMFQVRAWYARYGVGTPDWRIRPDDHLALQLEFISLLLAGVKGRERLEEVARFMDEHLLRWLGDFSRRVATRCATPYFAGVAMLTDRYCEELRDLLSGILQKPRPSPQEIEERMNPRSGKAEPVPVKFVPGIGPAV